MARRLSFAPARRPRIRGSAWHCHLLRHPYAHLLGPLLLVRAREPRARAGLPRMPAFALPGLLRLLRRRGYSAPTPILGCMTTFFNHTKSGDEA